MTCSSRLGFACAFLLLPSLGGCPDKSSPGPVSIDELVSRLVAAICNFEVACELMPDVATCLAAEPLDVDELATLKAGVAAGRIRYDAAKAGRCLEWYERYYGTGGCTQSGRAAFINPATEACEGLLVGTIATGGACLMAGECAGGLCQPTDTTCVQQCCPGICAARPAPVPVGGDCTTLQPNQSCATGSVCIGVTSSGARTCLKPSTVEGSACASFFECASPLFCAIDDTTGSGVCRRAAASGTTCDASAFSFACDDIRDTCAPVTGTCVPRTAVGGTCDPARIDCIGYAQCVGTTCVALPKPGAACTPGGSADCLGSLECSAQTSTCVAPPPDDSCG
jgi:hypothetical protein